MIGSHLLDGKYQGDVLEAMKTKILNQRYQAIHNGGKVVITEYLQDKFDSVEHEGISGNEAIAIISERNKEAGLKETVDIVRGIDRHKKDEIALNRVNKDASHQLKIEDGYSFVDGKKVKNVRYLPLSWKKNPITGQRDGSVTSMPWVYNYIKYATLFYSIAELESIKGNTKFTENDYTNLYTKLTELLSIVPNLSNFGIDNKVAGFVVNEENIDTIIEGAKNALKKLDIYDYDSKIKYFIYKDDLVNFKNSVIPTMGVQTPSDVIRKVASLWHNLSEDGVFSEMDGNKCKVKLTIETELIKNTTKIKKPNLTFNSLLVDDNNTLVEETIVDTKGNEPSITKQKKIDIVGKLDVPVFDEKITNFNDTIYTLNGVYTKDQIDLVNSLIPIIFEKLLY